MQPETKAKIKMRWKFHGQKKKKNRLGGIKRKCLMKQSLRELKNIPLK